MKLLSQIRQKDGSKFLHWADNVSAKSGPVTKTARFIVRFFLISLSEFKSNDLSVRSGALTYTLLLSLVPVLAMSTAVVKGLGGGDDLKEAAYAYIDTLESQNSTSAGQVQQNTQTEPEPSTGAENPLPAAPLQKTDLTGHLRSALDTLFSYVDNTNFAALGSFGIAGILLSVILVFGNIEKALNRIWHVENGRSIIRKISDYITIMVLMPISVNIAFAASAFLKNDNLSSKLGMLIPFIWLQTFILKLVPVLFITLTFFVIYIFFPNTKVRHRPALLGALFAAFFWFGVQNIYITMQVGVAKYNAIYGSFATFPLFLLWIYLGWMFILAGAQIAYTFQNLNSFKLVRTNSIPSMRLSAAFDILDKVHLAFKEQTPLTRECLAERLPDYESAVVVEVTDELTEAEFLYCVADGARILPSGPSETIVKRDIINLILGVEVPDTAGGIKSRKVLDAATNQAAGEPGNQARENNREE